MSINRNQGGRVCSYSSAEDKSTQEIHIDVTQIPDWVRDNLAAATLEAFKRAMKDPKTREMIERRTAERKRAHSIG